jgi:hypothetical protein
MKWNERELTSEVVPVAARAKSRDCCEVVINKQTPSAVYISSMLPVLS